MNRYQLQWDALIGFIGFFAALACLQAVLNLFAPAPALWPGPLAASLVVATWGAVKAKTAALARRSLSPRGDLHPERAH